MQEDVERAQKAGFDAHLTKPVNLQKLEATMPRVIVGGGIGDECGYGEVGS